MHTRVADLNLPAVQQVDDRRIEVIANGLSVHTGSQLANDTTLVAPLTSSGQPHDGEGGSLQQQHSKMPEGPKNVRTQSFAPLTAAAW